MRISLRETVAYAILGAALVAVQVALAFLPNIELVSLLIIAYACVFNWRALFPVFVFVLTEGLIYGFGLWFINYLYVWPLLLCAALFLKRGTNGNSRLPFSLLSAFFGLFFGALCALPYFLIGGPASALAYWISGIPFDIVHALGNGATAFLLFLPLCRILKAGAQKLKIGH